MNRRHMARDHGMLFDFGVTRRVMMWMKNTYLPLDMLFIAKDGKIETIRENAVPLSEAIIDSRVPIAFVLRTERRNRQSARHCARRYRR